MDPIKDAFEKVKQDMDFLFLELQEIKRTLKELKNTPTHQQITPTHPNTSTDNSYLEAFSTGNKGVSTGNQGVPTDRQTNQQTDRHIQKFVLNQEKIHRIDRLEHVSEILDSLDELKKEVRFKFKRLTSQEMVIFSTIYQLEEQGLIVDYSLISEKLKLSESSIRDYIGRIMKKGIPLDKIKQNNKKIILSIPQDLKKIASLQTIIQLRGL
ncbi:MAG: hypothetical protein IIA87_00220 [Nanoarchaeota archaeon]|nr:hypothetical protein [Nanoarchaeota archaeon]